MSLVVIGGGVSNEITLSVDTVSEIMLSAGSVSEVRLNAGSGTEVLGSADGSMVSAPLSVLGSDHLVIAEGSVSVDEVLRVQQVSVLETGCDSKGPSQAGSSVSATQGAASRLASESSESVFVGSVTGLLSASASASGLFLPDQG